MGLSVISQRQSQEWRIAAVDDPDKQPSKPIKRRHSFDWLKKAPRIRYRRSESRCPDQLLELTVLNERLLGSSPWEVRRKVEYLKKRQENWDMVYEIIVKREAAATLKTIEEASGKVEMALSEQSRESKSVVELRKELMELQKEIEEAHEKLHFTQSCVAQNLNRIQTLKNQLELGRLSGTVDGVMHTSESSNGDLHGDRVLNCWYPVAFAKNLKDKSTLIPFELLKEPWVLFRDEHGNPACVQDQCAHRACPLSIGKVVDGQIACPYHGWQYDRTGTCVKMPSTVYRLHISVDTLPAVERDGFIWVWPGTGTPPIQTPAFANMPDDALVVIEAETTAEVDQTLLLSNLMDEETPFKHLIPWLNLHTSKQSTSPLTDCGYLWTGSWRSFPAQTFFAPPCCVTSRMEVTEVQQSGKQGFMDQLHICLPVKEGSVRVLHRVSLNVWKWTAQLPFMSQRLKGMADKGLKEEISLAKAQQERMKSHGSHNKLGFDSMKK